MYATDLPHIGQTQTIPTAIRNGNSHFCRLVDTAVTWNADPNVDPKICVQAFANGFMARRHEDSELFIQTLTLANYKHKRFATSTVEPLRRRR